jgi:hypothetical protein
VPQRSSEWSRVCLPLSEYRRIEVVSSCDLTPRRMTEMRRAGTRLLKFAVSRRAATKPLPSAAPHACKQHNAAKLLGWTVFRLTSKMLTFAHVEPVARFVDMRLRKRAE